MDLQSQLRHYIEGVYSDRKMTGKECDSYKNKERGTRLMDKVTTVCSLFGEGVEVDNKKSPTWYGADVFHPNTSPSTS